MKKNFSSDMASKFVTANSIDSRPNANNGLWLMFLLPSCILISAVKHPLVLTLNYKLWSVCSSGLLISSLAFYVTLQRQKNPQIFNIWNTITAFIVTSIVHLSLDKGYLFSLYSGILCTFVYHKVYICIVKSLPRCFTLGEASVVTQGLILFLYSLSLNLHNAVIKPVGTSLQIASLIIQVGLMGIGIISFTVYLFNINNSLPFYTVVSVVFAFIIILPLQVFLKQNPVLWIFNQILYDVGTLKIFMYWSVCFGFAILGISKQIWRAQKASTSTRKIFHVLMVLVYLPGLLHRCTFLYLASGVTLGILISLELLRLKNMPPFGQYLQEGYVVLSDEKDAGVLALTPLYLLVGCSLPIWIHPAPCDVTDSAAFSLLSLLSGLLSVGVGDTAASIVGSHIGRHKWNGTNKTKEGTLASIISQFILILLLINFGFLEALKTRQCIEIVIAVVLSSLAEAKTNQVDNLTLPMIMYIFLT